MLCFVTPRSWLCSAGFFCVCVGRTSFCIGKGFEYLTGQVAKAFAFSGRDMQSSKVLPWSYNNSRYFIWTHETALYWISTLIHHSPYFLQQVTAALLSLRLTSFTASPSWEPLIVSRGFNLQSICLCPFSKFHPIYGIKIKLNSQVFTSRLLLLIHVYTCLMYLLPDNLSHSHIPWFV